MYTFLWVVTVLTASAVALAWLDLNVTTRRLNMLTQELVRLGVSHDNWRCRLEKLESDVAALTKKLGYEEEEQFLDDAIIWDDASRAKHLGSLFPRMSALEMRLEDLKSDVWERFELNGLKHRADLSPEEYSEFWRAAIRRPRWDE